MLLVNTEESRLAIVSEIGEEDRFGLPGAGVADKSCAKSGAEIVNVHWLLTCTAGTALSLKTTATEWFPTPSGVLGIPVKLVPSGVELN